MSDIGVYGLGTMGQNLALNFADKGFRVSVFNRRNKDEEKIVETFIAEKCHGTNISGFVELDKFISSLERPRRILLMIKAGSAVDEVLDYILTKLDEGDIIIDGGNSLYLDTNRRIKYAEQHKIKYVGCGISGGAEGALIGSSIMLGGTKETYVYLKDMLQSISAKNIDGSFCCEWFGGDGVGHYIKMVHNGIEYSIMQILAEAYDLQKRMLQMDFKDIVITFKEWSKTELKSYLLDISCDIIAAKNESGTHILDLILDHSKQKGTGKEAVISSLNLCMGSTMIFSAVDARFLSNMTKDRKYFLETYGEDEINFVGDRKQVLLDLYDAVYISQLMAYTQGLKLIHKASKEYQWNINLKDVLRVWKNGCIIQSEMIDMLNLCVQSSIDFNLFQQKEIVDCIRLRELGWRTCCNTAIINGIPIPAILSSLSFFDTLRSKQLPANLIQAQRDYFGSHGVEKVSSIS